MVDSLTIQSELAADFLETEWEPIKKQARETISSLASEIEEVILCGCGDSHHAARNLEMALTIWSGRRVRSTPAMETSRYLIPALNPTVSKTLVIGISASGEVARTLEAIELGIAVGAQTLALTGSDDSSLARTAQMTLSLSTPSIPPGPGLLSYLASLLMGFAVVDAIAPASRREELERVMQDLPELLRKWRIGQIEMGEEAAKSYSEGAVVFLGSGPSYGSALFAAAKLIEAAGMQAWGQDVEEWAHLEYFCEPSSMPTWLLSSKGRSERRESEVAAAARAIGRQFYVSVWKGGRDWPPHAREALAPLGLWVGPVAFASRMALSFNEQPFRGFGGGRSRIEGGGASRIRSSERVSSKEASDYWLKG
ncbi:MAG TPA: SIS domain-containing protein [Anaerolineae bacterium]|nr:SIS domain-containing protein [Anaerolineae bacterium]